MCVCVCARAYRCGVGRGVSFFDGDARLRCWESGGFFLSVALLPSSVSLALFPPVYVCIVQCVLPSCTQAPSALIKPNFTPSTTAHCLSLSFQLAMCRRVAWRRVIHFAGSKLGCSAERDASGPDRGIPEDREHGQGVAAAAERHSECRLGVGRSAAILLGVGTRFPSHTHVMGLQGR